jgi:hypothetical protein
MLRMSRRVQNIERRLGVRSEGGPCQCQPPPVVPVRWPGDSEESVVCERCGGVAPVIVVRYEGDS